MLARSELVGQKPPDPKMAHKMAVRIAIRELPRDSRIADAMIPPMD